LSEKRLLRENKERESEKLWVEKLGTLEKKVEKLAKREEEEKQKRDK